MHPTPAGDRSASSSVGLWRSFAERASNRFGMTGPAEFTAAAVLIALFVVFKLLNTARYKFDTDESQHLHVVWGWARGFVQYRDIWDNHMPLFQMVFAPIYGLIGDHALVLLWMRFILLPMYGVVLWCTYRLGSLLFSKRVGLWSAIAVSFYPGYHFCSLEFRTDNLWAPLWLLCVLTLVKEGFSKRAAWTGGILLGLCFGISMKTTLLLMSLLVSGSLTVFLVGPDRLGLSWKYLAGWTARFAAAACLIPATIMLAFASQHVWPAFRYWVFENNVVPGLRNHPAWWIIILPITFPFTVYAARLLVRGTEDPILAFRRAFLFLICGFYIPALWGFWPLVTRQDYLPHQPLAFVFYTAAMLLLSDHWAARGRGMARMFRSIPVPALVSVCGFMVALIAHPFLVDGEKAETDVLRQTLRLTDPGDFVLDEKGETVFRQRAFKPIWEPCVMARIRRGLMVDDAAQRCIDTHTCVARKGHDFSTAAARFVDENYLPVGDHQLQVAGGFLQPPKKMGDPIEFEVIIAAPYEIIASNGTPLSGLLDGTVVKGARYLEAGRHTFVKTSVAEPRRLAFIWAQAADRGFSPF